MTEIIATVGMVMNDRVTGTKYRIIYISNEKVVVCKMEDTKLILLEYDQELIIQFLAQDGVELYQDESKVFDISSFTDSVRSKYEENRKIMYEIEKEYGPDYMELMGRKKKKVLYEIMEKYHISKSKIWRIIRNYLQSGMREYSLLDQKVFVLQNKKEKRYSKKPGKQSKYLESAGIIVTEDIKEIFDWGIKEYKSGRWKSFQSVYVHMMRVYFSSTDVIDGEQTIRLKPESERPTFYQFYYYAHKRLTRKEINRIKTSAEQQRNDHRLLLSDSLDGVKGPGDLVEIDACEVDISLVSEVNPEKTVGRPVVYFMIDVYTRIILAVSVSFDNNSALGITNLFLNLSDNKHEYCARYGITYTGDDIWPSNIIPRRVRVDRGAEFKGKEFDRLCIELGIEKQIVPGAMGSLKGGVEQSFHRLQSEQREHIENHGLIEKRYDSHHHKEASLNIRQYTAMVINYVLNHNQTYNEYYRTTKDMQQKQIKPIPALLWKYGVERYGHPRPISDIEQYRYRLLSPVKAKISRRGIEYKKLWYFPSDDDELLRKMFELGNKREVFIVRIDKRYVGAVYYEKAGKLAKVPLNTRMVGNQEFENYTLKEWEDYLKSRREMDARGRVYNHNVKAYAQGVNESIVAASIAKRQMAVSDEKSIREEREKEKQRVSRQGKIEIAKNLEVQNQQLQIAEDDRGKKNKRYDDMNADDAMERFWEMEELKDDEEEF